MLENNRREAKSIEGRRNRSYSRIIISDCVTIRITR